MAIVQKILVFPLVLLAAANGAALADQQHVVDPAQLAAAVSERLTREDADRAAVREALERPEVRQVATSMGVDPARIAGVADTLAGHDLEQAAATARQVNGELAGGASTVVISTTTIIIVLLIIILLIVALK